MRKEAGKRAYEAPQAETVLIELEQCIALSDKNKNDIYEEEFD